MKIETFPVNLFEMNCYVYFDEKSKEGVIIDPAAYAENEKQQIKKFISDNEIKIKHILITHGHIDHILGNAWAKEFFKVPVLMHENDLPLIDMVMEQAAMFGLEFPKPPVPDKLISENDIIEAGNTKLKVILTPGHSPGSVCFVDEKNKLIFGGDCLFKNSIGRTDLWMGDIDVLLDSIDDKILTYDDDYLVYPGHYEMTSIGEEKLNNPFLNGAVDGYV